MSASTSAEHWTYVDNDDYCIVVSVISHSVCGDILFCRSGILWQIIGITCFLNCVRASCMNVTRM